jgi:hypothetical protein
VVSPDGAAVYFSVVDVPQQSPYKGGGIMKVATAGGPVTLVALEVDGGTPGVVALEGTTIVYGVDEPDGVVHAIDLVDGMVASCGPELTDLGIIGPLCSSIGDDAEGANPLSPSLILSDGDVYWGALIDHESGVRSSVARPFPESLMSSIGGGPITGFAKSGDAVYLGVAETCSNVIGIDCQGPGDGPPSGYIEEAPPTAPTGARTNALSHGAGFRAPSPSTRRTCIGRPPTASVPRMSNARSRASRRFTDAPPPQRRLTSAHGRPKKGQRCWLMIAQSDVDQ